MRSPIKIAFVGGGEGSFIIGAAHKPGSLMDGRFQLVAGAFSRSPEKSKAAAAGYLIDPKRAYGSYEEMLRAEIARPDGARAVVIGTPNHTHVEIALLAHELGFHIFCDKPLSNNLESAQSLYDAVTGARGEPRAFVVTHNYTRSAMAVMAAEMVQLGMIGKVHTIEARYRQGWLASALELDDQKQAEWRTDPARAGAGCFGDIAVHAFAQALLMGQVVPNSISANLRTVVEGRKNDDCGDARLTCHGGAVINLVSSQVMHGHANDHCIEVHGTAGSLYWRQEQPDLLQHRENGQPLKTYQQGACKMTQIAASLCRTPGGHPEGYLEAFGNVYRLGADQIEALQNGQTPAENPLQRAPGIELGLMGNVFIDLAQKSSAQAGARLAFNHPLFAAPQR